jgi:DNA-binding IclR family transcriptional regulator
MISHLPGNCGARWFVLNRLSGMGDPTLLTVDRALQVLLLFSESHPQWGVVELSKALGTTTSSAHRLLDSLAARGFLRSDPNTRKYLLGPALWQLTRLWERTGALGALASQVLRPLATRTGRTAVLAIPDGAHVRCVAAVQGEVPLRTQPLVGDLFPAHAGAISRGYFAFLPAQERRQLLSGRVLGRYTRLTRSDERALEALLAETLESGFAISAGEYDPETRAVAVPVFLHGRVVGSLGLVESTAQAPVELAALVPDLEKAAGELTALIDHTVARHRPRRKGA